MNLRTSSRGRRCCLWLASFEKWTQCLNKRDWTLLITITLQVPYLSRVPTELWENSRKKYSWLYPSENICFAYGIWASKWGDLQQIWWPECNPQAQVEERGSSCKLPSDFRIYTYTQTKVDKNINTLYTHRAPSTHNNRYLGFCCWYWFLVWFGFVGSMTRNVE